MANRRRRYFEVYIGSNLVYEHHYRVKTWDYFVALARKYKRDIATFVAKVGSKSIPMGQSKNGKIYIVEPNGTLFQAWVGPIEKSPKYVDYKRLR